MNNDLNKEEDYDLREQRDYLKRIYVIRVKYILILILLLLLGYYYKTWKDTEEEYLVLEKHICNAALEYEKRNSGLIDETKPGTREYIKLKDLADVNLIEKEINDPRYKVNFFRSPILSLNLYVLLSVSSDNKISCEGIRTEDKDKTPPSKVTIISNTSNKKDSYNKDGSWYGGIKKEEVTLVVEAQDKESKICKFQIIDGKNIIDFKPLNSKSNKGEYTWSTEGNKEGYIKKDIYIKAINCENMEGSNSDLIKIRLDSIGPKTNFTQSISDENEWIKDSKYVVKYLGKDDGIGTIDKYEYTYDDVKKIKEPKIDGSTKNLEKEFNADIQKKYVYVRAIDKLGNIGEWTEGPAYLNMDVKEPTISKIEIDESQTDKLKINMLFEDETNMKSSGFLRYEYKLDSGTVKTLDKQDGTIEISTVGVHKLELWSYDKVGNKSQVVVKDKIVVLPKLSLLSLNKGNTTTLSINIPGITFTSSNNSVATINNSGVINAINQGATTITASIYGKSTSTILGVDLVQQPVIDNNKAKTNTYNEYQNKPLEVEFLNNYLKNKIREAGYQTRNGVLAAVRFLALEFKYGIQYISGDKGRYRYDGLNISNSNTCWNCTDAGFNCSGFVEWAIFNAGYDLTEDNNATLTTANYPWISSSALALRRNRWLNYYLGNYITGTSYIDYNGDWNMALNSTVKPQPGDIIWRLYSPPPNGHVGIILEINKEADYVRYVHSFTYGLYVETDKISTLTDESKRNFTRIILMDNAYNNRNFKRK